MFFKLYAVALPVFIALDALWLGIVARRFYSAQIGFLFKENVNWAAAAIFYLLFLVGLILFVILPALDKGWFELLWRAALFGLITYATYDLTNLATVAGWPLLVTIVDLLWGMVLSVAVSAATYAVAHRFFS